MIIISKFQNFKIKFIDDELINKRLIETLTPLRPAMAIEGAIHNDNPCSAVLDRFALGLKDWTNKTRSQLIIRK